MVIYSRLHETRPMGHEEEDLTAGLMCPPEMPPLTQTPIAIPAKKIRGTYQISKRTEIRGGCDIPMAHPKFMERNDCETFVNSYLDKSNVILTPRADGATSGFVESTTWQADPAPKMIKSATPKNSAMGLRIACLW